MINTKGPSDHLLPQEITLNKSDQIKSKNVLPTWFYFIPVIGWAVLLAQAVSRFYVSYKVRPILEELSWTDATTRKLALETLGILEKGSWQIESDIFYENTAKLAQHLNGSVETFKEGNVLKAYHQMRQDPTDLINEWYQARSPGQVFDRDRVLKELGTEADEIFKLNGHCLEYFYLKELQHALADSTFALATIFRSVRFVKERRQFYTQVESKEDFEKLRSYDVEWIQKTKGGYELETQLGCLLEEIAHAAKRLIEEDPQDKVVVMTCSYGNGHNATAKAVESYLPGKNVSILDPTTDVLLETQWAYKLGRFLGKDWKDPDIFNYVLRNQLYWVDNTKRYILDGFYRLLGKKSVNGIIEPCPKKDTHAKELLRKRFLRERPEQIVTVYHMHLHPIMEVAKEMGIPVLHLATDYDCKGKDLFNQDHTPEVEHFMFSSPMDNEKVMKTTKPFSGEQVKVGGFPVRKEFLSKQSARKASGMRKERKLSAKAKVVLLMGGGGGQKVPFPYELAKVKDCSQRIHMVVIAGANEEFGREIEELKAQNPNITFEVARGDNPDRPYFVSGKTISDFMDIADVVVSKSGGVSTAEALQKGLPILFDHRVTPFTWEEYNIELVKGLGRGISIRTAKGFFEDLQKGMMIKKDRSIVISEPDKKIPRLMEEMMESAQKDTSFFQKRNSYARPL